VLLLVRRDGSARKLAVTDKKNRNVVELNEDLKDSVTDQPLSLIAKQISITEADITGNLKNKDMRDVPVVVP